MKSIIIVLSSLILLSVRINSGWVISLNPYPTVNLYDVSFVSETTGYACGSNGKVLYTTTAGYSWLLFNTPTSNTLLDVDSPSFYWVYIVGGNAFLKSTNRGYQWLLTTVNGISSINSVSFSGNNNGFICGNDGTVARTTDAGTSWNVITISSQHFKTIRCFDSLNAVVAGESGTAFRTTNGGLNWVQSQTGTNNLICNIAFSDSYVGYFTILGMSEQISRTSNGGLYWYQVTPPGNSPGLNALSVVGPNWIYGVGPAGRICRSTNSGFSWESQSIGDTSLYFRGICMFNAEVGYIVGNNGKIYKTTNSGVGLVQANTNIPKTYLLEQNYPNPFNPLTNINFSVPKTGAVKLTVYDAAGREAAVLFNGELSAGTYNYDFDASHLASGIYFYKLESNDFSQTKKMVLVK